MKKTYITAQQLLDDSLALALRIAESGFRPDLIVGIWRGGTPVGIVVQEVLEYLGIANDHCAIRTSSYAGIGQRNRVHVQGLEYLEDKLAEGQSLLLVDDVFDTGLSLERVIAELEQRCPGPLPAVRIATPYYKPANNATARTPDYFLHTTDDWLVFPHELIGLDEAEIRHDKPGIDTVRRRLLALRGAERD